MKKQLMFGLIILTIVAMFVAGCKTQTGEAFRGTTAQTEEPVEVIPGLIIFGNKVIYYPHMVEVTRISKNELSYTPVEGGFRTDADEGGGGEETECYCSSLEEGRCDLTRPEKGRILCRKTSYCEGECLFTVPGPIFRRR